MKEKLSFSPMKGTKGHCFNAQVFDSKGESLAVLCSDHGAEKCTYYARLFSYAPQLLDLCERINPQRLDDTMQIVMDMKYFVEKIKGCSK